MEMTSKTPLVEEEAPTKILSLAPLGPEIKTYYAGEGQQQFNGATDRFNLFRTIRNIWNTM
jgi:hypothetical protein